MLIAILPSDGNVKRSDPLDAFREEQAVSRRRVLPSPFLSSSSHTRPTRNVVSQAARESKIDHTQRHISVLSGNPSA